MNMRFIRKARRNLLVRDKAVDLLSKALLIGISVLVCLWMVSGAHAAPASITGIQGHLRDDGSYAIEFALSQKVDPADVSVEYDRNFIQVSLRGVSAYPARTETLNQGSLEKVFTYQYEPDLARARILLKTKAAAIKGKVSYKVTPTGLRIAVRDTAAVGTASDTVQTKAAAAGEASAGPSGDTDEERIVQEILNESKNGAKAAVAAAPAASTSASASAPAAAKTEDVSLFADKKTETTEDQALFPAKTASAAPKETGASRILASLLLVIGVIGACAVAFRRFALGKGISFARQNRVIETIATQGLGPKRSVAVIKVLDQYMVIGMAGDGMSLLANLGSDVKIDKYLDQIDGPGSSFSDSLEGALAGVTAAGKTDLAGPPLTQKIAKTELGIRSSIKNRLAGFKPL